ncbi:rod shape-determining protein [Catonella massiliensis]|uniref:Cell shape-determining protein MreB n=1 Tax=Catonella massiliensis TaxID=2799636 RepID=A0ABS1IZ19_9FIRM|nr:rod shape-determining protein [Catonella massiliensis]MBF1014288.1 rod shape-determining protein [Lachnospiraceae bacterium]MBK5897133.1 rod shape-determining protein [Catonella massiliensis]
MLGKSIGIDLGTKRIKYYRKGDGIIFDEENCIAIENKDEIRAIGDEAAEMVGRTPETIEVIYPVNRGVIANVSAMELLFNASFDRIYGKAKRASGTNFVIALPTDITEVEKRSFADLVHKSGLKPKNVSLVDKPICVAMAAGLDIMKAKGVMTVDVGADTTEIAIIALGGIVRSRLLPTAGNKFDESICNYIRQKCALVIGKSNAEQLKMGIAGAVSGQSLTMQVNGRDVVTGLPKRMEIESDLVYEAIKDDLKNITENIKSTLEHIPPEVSSDIIDAGIYVTGGSARIGNFDKLLNAETSLKINILEDPQDSVINGLGKLIDEDNFKTQPYIYRQPGYSVNLRNVNNGITKKK